MLVHLDILQNGFLLLTFNLDSLANDLAICISRLSLPSCRKQLSHVKPRHRVSLGVEDDLFHREKV
jgi:hypothetical protein